MTIIWTKGIALRIQGPVSVTFLDRAQLKNGDGAPCPIPLLVYQGNNPEITAL
jgi:hypothetical protein